MTMHRALPPIVVAEDDRATSLQIAMLLAGLKLANPVVTASDGTEAIAALRRLVEQSRLPSLILLDVNMPGCSGLEVLAWVREQPALADVPVIMLTSSADLDEITDAYAQGAASYLIKPIGIRALSDVLRDLERPWALVSPASASASAQDDLAEVTSPLAQELSAAISGGQLVLHYQPIVELATSRIVGAEALVRWNHPDRGLLPPAAFVELAETTGLIIDLGRWVLDQACADAVTWPLASDGRPLELAVNVSGVQLRRGDLVGDVDASLLASGLDPARLMLEITETTLLSGTPGALDGLTHLQGRGVCVAMDDFGTGYSSLARLAEVSVDLIKVDKLFIDDIAVGEDSWALARAMVNLVSALGKRTVAEGIETAAQLAHLRALHCELGQGYLFSRPIPSHDLIALASSPSVVAPTTSSAGGLRAHTA